MWRCMGILAAVIISRHRVLLCKNSDDGTSCTVSNLLQDRPGAALSLRGTGWTSCAASAWRRWGDRACSVCDPARPRCTPLRTRPYDEHAGSTAIRSRTNLAACRCLANLPVVGIVDASCLCLICCCHPWSLGSKMMDQRRRLDLVRGVYQNAVGAHHRGVLGHQASLVCMRQRAVAHHERAIDKMVEQLMSRVRTAVENSQNNRPTR